MSGEDSSSEDILINGIKKYLKDEYDVDLEYKEKDFDEKAHFFYQGINSRIFNYKINVLRNIGEDVLLNFMLNYQSQIK